MKLLVFSINAPPELPGFKDKFALFDSDARGNLLCHEMCSCGPNWVHPGTGEPWQKHYGCIAAGVWLAKCVRHVKFGVCLLFNGGFPLKARNANPNQGGQYLVAECFFHHSFPTERNPDWRGSAGCFTALPDIHKKVMDFLYEDEMLTIRANDCLHE